MKPEPSQKAPASDYPSFRKFHISRKAIAAGTALILAGCNKKPEITPVMLGEPRIAHPPTNLVEETDNPSGCMNTLMGPPGEMIAPAPPEADSVL
ncbi:MAG: hypothetical protein JXR25_00945 [Pontiellaceae bacterium]|nr:hypothetical protein [Pontiellaceae bacterium]MBN2783366.1 hypothetical protein [Pontiellaceae bacterium]